MKSSLFLLCLIVGIFIPVICPAQDFAPSALTADFLTVNVTGANGPLATTGSYKLFASAATNKYTVLGDTTLGITLGTYGYTKTGTNLGSLTLNDKQAGFLSGQLTFTSTNTGSISLSLGGVTQTGAFTLTNYAQVTLPRLFLPAVTNNHFNAFLSGQPGFNYDIQSSTNAMSWGVWTNLPIANQTTNFGDSSTSPVPHFYRARIHATAFAPATITNQTLNFSIGSGGTHLPTNGIFEFMATNISNFQILAGPGLTNGAGHYSYRLTGDDSATLNYTDETSGISYTVNLVYTSPRGGHFYLQAVNDFEAGTFTANNGPTIFLGNVKFTPDSSRGTSKLFAANGTPLTFSVTNSTGYIFQLSLPADALITPRVISMAPFSNIDSSQSWLPIVAGVQLEPDGIQFSDAVTLTVTPPGALGSNAAIVMAGDDGSSLYFVASTNQNTSFSTKLAHFTSAGVSNPSPGQQGSFDSEYANYARAAYMAAKLDLLALEGEQASQPPDYDLSCDPNDPGSGTREIATDIYVSNLFIRETRALDQLMNAAIMLSAIAGDFSGVAEVPGLARQFVESEEFNKVNLLFATYQFDPKKFIPLVRSAKAAELQDTLHLGNGLGHFDNQIQYAGEQTREFYFDKLKDSHDYSVIMPLNEIENLLIMQTGDPGGGDFINKLSKELTFHISLEFKLNGISGTEDAKGDFTLNAGPNLFPCTGSGTINYLSGSAPPFTLVPGQSYSVNATIDNIDACLGNTISVVLDRFGPNSENYIYSGTTVGFGFMQRSATDVFEPELAKSGPDSGQYVFPQPLQNKNPVVVDATVVGPANANHGEVDVVIKVEHTPQ